LTMVGFVKTFDLLADHGHGEHAVAVAHTVALYSSLFVMSLGIAIAFFWYMTEMGARVRKACRAAIPRIYGWAFHKYYVDEVVEAGVIQVTIFLAEISAWIDSAILDGFVDGTGSVYLKTADVSGEVDDDIVDGAVTLAGNAAWGGGALLGRIQSGRVRNYLFGAVASVALFAVVMLYVAGN